MSDSTQFKGQTRAGLPSAGTYSMALFFGQTVGAYISAYISDEELLMEISATLYTTSEVNSTDISNKCIRESPHI